MLNSLTDYINNLLFEGITYTNAERRKQLERYLKNKNYDSYVNCLNKMLKDPKAKALLIDGFGGLLGKSKLKFSVQNIHPKDLVPMQSEIDLNKSIKFALTKPESLLQTFDKPIIISHPLVTYNSKYIIDGHHSWLQSVAINPDGLVECFNYDGDLSEIQMLKLVQGTIAAVKAKNNEEELPKSTAGVANLYEMTQQEIRKWIKATIDTDSDIISIFVNMINECYDYDSVVEWLTKRLYDVTRVHRPLPNSPDRDKMPQLYKGGTDSGDKKSALPTSKGSAMNKLKDSKYEKSFVK